MILTGIKFKFSNFRHLSVGHADSHQGNLKRKNRSNLADTDPMEINPDIRFSDVGGLSEIIDSLKEMIVFPIMYSEVFEKFHITPPKGVLFHGPPGKIEARSAFLYLIGRMFRNRQDAHGKGTCQRVQHWHSEV
jgi:ATP-dependent Zn protease